MNRLNNILVAVDFSDCSKAALAQAVRIAGWNGAALHALHVIEPLVVSDVAWAMEATEFRREQPGVPAGAREAHRLGCVKPAARRKSASSWARPFMKC